MDTEIMYNHRENNSHCSLCAYIVAVVTSVTSNNFLHMQTVHLGTAVVRMQTYQTRSVINIYFGIAVP